MTDKEKDYGTLFVCTSCNFSKEGELSSQCKDCSLEELYYQNEMDEAWNNE